MLERYGRLLVIGGAVAALALALWWLWLKQPNELRNDLIEQAGGDGEPKSECYSTGYEAAVICERDCRVTFGLCGAGESLDTYASDEEAANSDEVPGGREETIAQHDLLAQERMAYWTTISAILATGALAGLLLTLWETRRIGQAQVRAYLSASKAELSMGADFLFIRLTISNCGGSPSQDGQIEVNSKIYIRERMGDVTTGLDLSGTPNEHKASLRPVPANGHEVFMSMTGDFDREIVHQLAGTYGVDVQVFGTVKWADVFGRGDSQTFSFCSLGVTTESLKEYFGKRKRKRWRWAYREMAVGELLRPGGIGVVGTEDE